VPSVSDLSDRVRGWLHREPKPVVPRTILIVDGNSANRQSTARLVDSLGYEPIQCEGIGAALRQLEEQDPECVLLSFDLDDADGFEALTRLHEQEPELSIVMLTRDQWDSRAVEAMRKGAIAYLPQPFGANDLREVLGRH